VESTSLAVAVWPPTASARPAASGHRGRRTTRIPTVTTRPPLTPG